MESAVVVFSAIIAVASLAVALIVAGHVLRRRGKPLLTPEMVSRRGLSWLLLGLSATLVFALLRVSVLIPLPVAGLGVFFLIKDGRRRRDQP